ncbi:thermonuclease family protein [Lysinibacillus telephonicus]|uniref:thermonuclease family protein n=1 Tax=Lysinibacillus telephonicus TaxID=1714840 RepID=UPI0031FCABEC
MKKWIFILFTLTIISGCSLSNVKDEATVKTVESNDDNSSYDISSFKEFPLVSVVDGDTIKILYNGSTELVRFLLVDTPETNHPTLGQQPYGEEAKEYTKKLLEDQESVYLEFDVSYRDKYNRLLAYIYTEDGKNVQEELLKNGLARVAYIYEPNTKHVDWFESVQKNAQKQAIGIWSIENYVTDRGYDKSVFDGTDSEAKNNNGNDSACLIKGNINSKGDKIYHSPGQQNYESTKPEEMFCTAEEAETAGFKAAPR